MSTMGFGEDYHGMSDREILIEVAIKQKIMEAKLDTINCPSPRCQNHENRLNTIETADKTKDESGAKNLAYIAVLISAIVLIVEVIAAVY